MDIIIKGFIIGIGKIIPGVSGSLLAIRLNIYEKMIDSINNLFKDFKNNLLFLTKLGFGILLAILIGSHVITYLLQNYYYWTLCIFIILIATGIPSVLKKTNNYFIAIVSFLIYFTILYFPTVNILSNYYFMGFLEAFTTIIPGISGTAIFISLGLYDELLTMFSHIYMFEFGKIIPFSIGFLIGTLVLVRFINYCFNNQRSKTYGAILGFLLGSIISMIIKR